MRLVKFWAVATLLPLYACNADDSNLAQDSEPVESAPQVQAPQVQTAPTTEAQAEDVVEAGEEVATETASQSEIVLAQADTSAAKTSRFTAGKDYEVVKPAQPTSAGPGEVEVLEFFMYTCPHCFNFEPHVNNYVADKPDYVKFVRVPVMFNDVAALHARAYYTAEILGVLDKTHLPMFEEIHINRNMLSTESELEDFFASHGVDREQFRGTFNSFAVEGKLKKGATAAQRLKISSVPFVAINGKYKTSGSMTRSYEKVIEVIEDLTAVEHSTP
jgi:thiol:disulfide interchange protein DsbA